jgi:hypothetical protein
MDVVRPPDHDASKNRPYDDVHDGPDGTDPDRMHYQERGEPYGRGYTPDRSADPNSTRIFIRLD